MTDVYNAFTKACKRGDLKQVKSLTQSNPSLDIDQYGGNALLVVGRNGHLNIMKHLIENLHADVQKIGTILLEEAAKQGFLDIVQYLVEDCGVIFLETPLFIAAENQRKDIVKYLMDRGVEHKEFQSYPETANAYDFCEKYAQEVKLEKATKKAAEMVIEKEIERAKHVEKNFQCNLKTLQNIGAKRTVRRRSKMPIPPKA